MGDELVLQGIAIPNLKNKTKQQKFIEEAFKQMLKTVDTLTEKEIQEYYIRVDGEQLTGIDLEVEKENFKNIIQTAQDIFTVPLRSVFVWERENEILYLAGGDSGGDSPSDTYDDLLHFNSLPDRITEMLTKQPNENKPARIHHLHC